MLQNVFPFDKVRAKCAVCDEFVDGTYKIGNKYYCCADYEIESIAEKLETKKTKQEEKEIKRFLKNV